MTARELPESQMMPRRMTPEMNDAILKAVSGAANGRRNPKAIAWNVAIAYSAIYRLIAEQEPK